MGGSGVFVRVLVTLVDTRRRETGEGERAVRLLQGGSHTEYTYDVRSNVQNCIMIFGLSARDMVCCAVLDGYEYEVGVWVRVMKARGAEECRAVLYCAVLYYIVLCCAVLSPSLAIARPRDQAWVDALAAVQFPTFRRRQVMAAFAGRVGHGASGG